MRLNSKIDKFVNSPLLSASIFITSGGYKAYKDYKHADKKYKDKFLVKDYVALSGAAAGMFIHSAGAGKFTKNKLLKQIYSLIPKPSTGKLNSSRAKHSIEITKEILKDWMNGVTLFTFGILGALGADYLLSKSGFEQPKTEENTYNNNFKIKYLDENLNRITDEKTKNAVYSRITDMPQMHIFASSVIGLQAMELAKDREFDKRLQHSTKCIINNALLPLLLLSTSSAFTKGMKSVYRIPIIFTSLVGGTIISNKAIEKFIHKS